MTTRVAVADRAIRLGGFALAHAALCIADGFGGPLIPFGAVEKRRLGGKRIIMRFAYVTPVRRDVEMSIERGRREVEAKLPQFKSHAFAYDGYAWYSGQAHPVQADRTDALFVEINDGTMEASIRLAQAYRRSMSGGFKLLGLPSFARDDFSALPTSTAQLNEMLAKGTRSHKLAASRWAAWST